MDVQADRKTIHMIGNSHIDVQWFWRWPEGMREVLATFRSALERMNEYPDFTFTASSVIYYRWVEEFDPGLMEEIRKRIREGRWQIVGGWVVEPDCNLPSGESFARNSLYGQRYLKNTFGSIARIAFCIDSFGHNSGLPAILSQSGFRWYVFMRPDVKEKQLPSPLFRWESEGGESIASCRIPCEYTAWFREHLERNIDSSIAGMGDRKDLLCFYGVGNHGGGPTKANIDHVLEAGSARDGFRLELSTLERFFGSADPAGLPSYRGELQKHSQGCYSSDSTLKKLNRFSETALSRAELLDAFGTLAAGTPEKKPLTARFAALWESLLFCQFHDTLAGTCIEEARDDAVRSLHAVLDGAERIAQGGLQAVLSRIDTRGPGFPLVLFNTRPYAVEDWVDTEVAWDCKKSLRLLDDGGNPVPYQRVMTSCMMINRNFGGRRRILFKASVPAFGFTVFRLVEEGELVPLPAFMSGPPALDNGVLRVDFDSRGRLASIHDRNRGRELLGGAVVPVLIADYHDTWGHGVESFNEKIDEFEVVRSETIEAGPVRFCVRIEYACRSSRFEQFLYLYEGDDRLFVKNALDFREHHAMVKLALPVAARTAAVRCGMSYGALVRPEADGGESFAQGWILPYDTGTGEGFAVASDSKYAYDLSGTVLSLTLARSPVYAHHIPTEVGQGGTYRFMDQGEQRFSFALAGAANPGDTGALVLLDSLEHPIEAVTDTVHAGTLPGRYGFAECSEPNVRITVVKGAEDGDGYILRLLETAGRPTSARITIRPWNSTFAVEVPAHRLVTFKVFRTDKGTEAVRVNILEFEESSDAPVRE